MKPMELNVMENIEGTGLFLYDREQPENHSRENCKKERIGLLEYSYGVLDGRDLLDWTLERMKRKCRKKFRGGR
jgi:hypothetical protein